MRTKTLFLPEARNDFLWAFSGSPRQWLFLWLVLINLTAFAAFGLDKWKAKRKERNPRVRRTRNRTLFLLAILGGSVGALLGMRVFHHKTHHRGFTVGIPLILLLQVLIPMGLSLWLP